MTARHRVLWRLLAGGVLAAVLLSWGLTWLLRTTVRETQQERLRAETALLAEWVRADSVADPQALAQRAAERLGVRVTLIDAAGEVLGDSARDETGVERMDNHLQRPEIQRALQQGSGVSIRHSASTNVDYVYVAWRVAGSGTIKFTRVALPLSQVEAGVNQFTGRVLAVVLAGVLLFSALTYLFVRGFSKPVEQIGEIVQNIGDGRLELDVPERGRDELYRLAVAINRMKRTLVQKLAELQEERGLFSSVISDMREGLLVVDPDRRIRLANEAARELLELQVDPTGHLIGEVIRHPTVIEDVETSLRRHQEVQQTVIRSAGIGRAFELHVTPLGESGEQGVLVLFFDITRLEALENVRREFVANVSHELRTPLTSIKAFIETIIESGLEDRDNTLKFLRIVQKHSDRMGALIDDLTDLSLIETGSISLDFRSVDLGRLAEEVAEQFEPKATARKVTLEIDLPSRFAVRADRRRLEQVLTNLVDNAIKFNREGGTVRLHGRRDGGTPVLTVEDTGVGIPADSLEKVFHRFYRVDVDRSRQAGGTGLGLAIVKHLLRLHGGTINVESELGRGTRFTVRLPAAA